MYAVSADTVREATLLQRVIKWQYANEEKEFINFDFMVNYHIEQAYKMYKRKKQNHTFCYESKLSINFESDPMLQENSDTGKIKEVRRLFTAKMDQGKILWNVPLSLLRSKGTVNHAYIIYCTGSKC